MSELDLTCIVHAMMVHQSGDNIIKQLWLQLTTPKMKAKFVT